EYKTTDLSIRFGGTTDDVMAGSDGGFGRDNPTSRRCFVNATILVPASGTASAFEAMSEHEATFTKKAGCGVTGDFLCTEKNYAGSTASSLRYTTTWVSQGGYTADEDGVGS